MSANPASDQLAATIADQRHTFSTIERYVGGELADQLRSCLPNLNAQDIGEVLMYAAQFVAGITTGAKRHPDRGTAADFGRMLTFALSEAGERLYTGSAS